MGFDGREAVKALLYASTARVVDVWGEEPGGLVVMVDASVAKKVGGE